MLSKIYESVIEERNFFDEDNKSKNDLPSPRSRGPPHKNYMSLKISTEANLSLLQDTSNDGLELLYLISCLKDGIKLNLLSELYGRDVTELVTYLDKLSLLEEGDWRKATQEQRENDNQHKSCKIKLTPYLIDHCQRIIDKESRNKLFVMISNFYTKFLEILYKMNRAIDINEYLNQELEMEKMSSLSKSEG